MKATFGPTGVLTLIAETPLEEYGMTRWREQNWVARQDVQLAEQGHWRGSCIRIETVSPHPAQPAAPNYGAGINKHYLRT